MTIETVDFIGHCVIYGVESWSGVLEWSHGVEFWSGFWSGMELDFDFFVTLLGQDFTTDLQTATELSGSDFGGNQ